MMALSLTQPTGSKESVVAIICLTVAGALFFKSVRNTHNGPPGPKGLPILGNALDLPPKFRWLAFSDMRKK
jgi:hypothetical protein